jgi:hypothetical protein
MSQSASTDVSDLPDLKRLAEVVRDRKERIVLRDDKEALAVISPLEPGDQVPSRGLTPEEFDAVMSTAGSWEGLVDIDAFKEEMRASRGSKRGPVDL